jgi:outer membrane murein-binding lipoprotein Lpp
VDPATVTIELLKALGIVLASFGAIYGALVRPMDKRLAAAAIACDPKVLEDIRELNKKVDRLQETVVKHCTRGEATDSAIERTEEAQRRLDERVSRTVTDDEFATYVAATNSQIQNLIEKVGHVAGTIEAWARGR